MKAILVLILLLSAQIARAGCCTGPGDPEYDAYNAGWDYWAWSRPQMQVHVLIGYGGVVTEAVMLERWFAVSRLSATLTSMATVMIAGAAKEVFFDGYNARSDTKAFWAGAVLGGATTMTFRF